MLKTNLNGRVDSEQSGIPGNRAPMKPGMGVKLDDEVLEDKFGRDWRNAETHSKDRSVMLG